MNVISNYAMAANIIVNHELKLAIVDVGDVCMLLQKRESGLFLIETCDMDFKFYCQKHKGDWYFVARQLTIDFLYDMIDNKRVCFDRFKREDFGQSEKEKLEENAFMLFYKHFDSIATEENRVTDLGKDYYRISNGIINALVTNLQYFADKNNSTGIFSNILNSYFKKYYKLFTKLNNQAEFAVKIKKGAIIPRNGEIKKYNLRLKNYVVSKVYCSHNGTEIEGEHYIDDCGNKFIYVRSKEREKYIEIDNIIRRKNNTGEEKSSRVGLCVGGESKDKIVFIDKDHPMRMYCKAFGLQKF